VLPRYNNNLAGKGSFNGDEDYLSRYRGSMPARTRYDVVREDTIKWTTS
jgi:hypothetical protein